LTRPPRYFFTSVLHPPTSPLFPYTTLFRSSLMPTLRSTAPRLKGAAQFGFSRLRWTSDCGSGGPCSTIFGPPSTAMRSACTTSRSEEHTSELQSRFDLVCRLLLEKKNNDTV